MRACFFDFAHGDDVTGLDRVGRDVDALAVDLDRLVETS